MIAEVRGEGLLIGLKSEVPNGELIDAFRAEKLLTVGSGRQCRAASAAADRRRRGNVAKAFDMIDRACARLSKAKDEDAEKAGRRMKEQRPTSFRLSHRYFAREELRGMI